MKHELANPGREKINVMVMSALTVDITNIDTSRVFPNQNQDIYLNKVIASCRNMFNIAVQSLEHHPDLSNVIILEHTPRFDTKDQDPSSIKPNLARIANATFGQLWLNSEFKGRISIGRHSLESPGSGPTHRDRYENTRTGKYDGVHFWGRSAQADFTNSVVSILMLALPENHKGTANEAGTAQGNSNHGIQRDTPTPNVHTKYSFNVFNSNMGNYQGVGLTPPYLLMMIPPPPPWKVV